MAGIRNWSPDDDAKLIALLESGVKRYRLVDHFPTRTRAAVESRAGILVPPTKQPPFEKRCTKLRDAINDLLQRMDPATRATCLGVEPQRIPGTERFHKTSSVLRLAA